MPRNRGWNDKPNLSVRNTPCHFMDTIYMISPFFFHLQNINHCRFRVRFSFCDTKCHVNDFGYSFRLFFTSLPAFGENHMSLSTGACTKSELSLCRLLCAIVRSTEQIYLTSYDRVEPSEWEPKIMSAMPLWVLLIWLVSDIELIWWKKEILLWFFDIYAHQCERDNFSPWSQVENIQNLTLMNGSVADANAVLLIFHEFRLFDSFSGIAKHDRRKSNLKCKWFCNRLMASIQHATIFFFFSTVDAITRRRWIETLKLCAVRGKERE